MQADGEIIETSLVETIGQTSALIQHNPDAVLSQAQSAARALKRVLDQKPDKVMMGKEQYLEFEDWQTVGRFYAITAKEDGDPEYVSFKMPLCAANDPQFLANKEKITYNYQIVDGIVIKLVSGFKASATAIDRDGNAISRATAYCLNDEDKWGARNKYVWGYICKDGSWSADDPGFENIVWEPIPGQFKSDGKPKNKPKKEKRFMGTESVPLFQLASMAQTRAAAKALRMVLSWVVVLGGFKPTPAEELDAEPQEQQPPQKQEPPKQGTNGRKQAPPQKEEPGDAWEPPEPITVEAVEKIYEHLNKLNRTWDAQCKKACEGIIGRPIGMNEEPKHLSQADGLKIISALGKRIAHLAKEAEAKATAPAGTQTI